MSDHPDPDFGEWGEVDPEFEEWLQERRREGPRVVRVGALRPGFHYVKGLDLEDPAAYHLVVMVTFDDPPLANVVTVDGRTVSRVYAPSDRVWTMDPAEVADAQDALHDAINQGALDPPDPRDYL